MTDFDRRRVMQLSLLAAAAGALPLGAAASAPANDPVHDFDSHMGSWHARHRRLRERLANNNEWIEFDGTCVMQPMMGGCANVDDNIFNMPGGAYRGVSLRAYNAKTRAWAIWWLDGRFPDKIDAPVVGSFKGGVGTFLSSDTFKDKPIIVRFLWSKITANTRRWEQAFSPDDGKTWETTGSPTSGGQHEQQERFRLVDRLLARAAPPPQGALDEQHRMARVQRHLQDAAVDGP